MNESIITSDSLFDGQHRTILRQVARLMIPPDSHLAVPGADDDLIFARILERAAGSSSLIKLIVAGLESASQAEYGIPFEKLSDRDAGLLLETFRTEHPMEAAGLVSIVASCYYEDDRVLGSIGHEARPPFPGGNDVPAGDWSLLDPVRQRKPFYRKVT